MKAEDYENAANALTTMSRSISDLNPEVIVEIYNKVIFRSMKEKSPKLYAIKESARRQVFFRAQLVKAEAAVKADPKNVKAQRRLGECHAELGDWPQALEAFSNADGELAKIAKSERGGATKPQELGDFWWDYETKSDTPTYRLHAAELYRKALADTSFNGLARTRTEQRVKESEKDAEWMVMYSSKPEAVGSPCAAFKEGEPFKVILDAKGVDIALVGCAKGGFEMGFPGDKDVHLVKFTRDFWFGRDCVTRRQYRSVVGRVPEKAKPGNDDDPICGCTWEDLRVFFVRLNARKDLAVPKGYVFRLPSEAEWEYVVKAGQTEKFTLADPNAWGVRDLLGTPEVMMDVLGGTGGRKVELEGEKGGHAKPFIVDMDYADNETDPVSGSGFSAKDGKLLVRGLWRSRLDKVGFAAAVNWRKSYGLDAFLDGTRFRVCLGPDLVAEKQAKK